MLRFIGDQLSAMSLELQNLFHAFALSEQQLKHILLYLDCKDVETLQRGLNQAAEKRALQSVTQLYVLQQSEQTPSISYAIAPLLCSVLDHSTHYVAQAEAWLTDFYQHYFRIDALASAKAQSLNNMQLCLALSETQLSPTEFYVASLLQALLDPNAKKIVTLGQQQLIAELKQQLMAYYAVEILEIYSSFSTIELTETQTKKLFWKRKDETLAQVSQQIAYDNSPLIAKLCDLSRMDAERFIDDLMYGEHVFEKVSVLGEFSDTVYKHQQEILHKMSA